ncbi:SMI1/KNR4 family protein [Acetivibrio cellulolyticus]|uniref:SMI1/KNR4 family protein n=1 Tax=Acetivibrio cellulolyticus TaxID=35830 RepID=UPI0001E2F5FF|nr:SMI1/KNR4 family protein [Acetivibrio cellulolyticus]
MKANLVDQIRLLRDQVPEAFGKPIEEVKIVEAEKTLGVTLPEEYKSFIKEFGSGAVGEAIIIGLSEAKFVETPSFVEESLRFREELPDEYKNIVVIGIDNSGNPVGFLPESPVVFVYDYDFGGRYDLAKDFNEYVEKSLNRTLDVGF